MNLILFGATGMVGQGALRECLRADDVHRVLSIGRSPLGIAHPKLHEITRADLFDYAGIETELQGYDACLFCLGASSLGMNERDYTRINHDLPLAAAQALLRHNPDMVFLYVSGAGTDASERGRTMWARVKGRTENALRRLPFRAVYLLRPGAIQPLHGVQSRTPAYRLIYRMAAPLFGLLRRAFPNAVLTTEEVGTAMLRLARRGEPGGVLEARDIAALARADTP